MPKFSIAMSGQKVRQYRDGVQALLRDNPPVNLSPDDHLTLNYDLRLDGSTHEQIRSLRAIVQMMSDLEVGVKATDLDTESVLLFVELGRLVSDMRFLYEERSICGKV